MIKIVGVRFRTAGKIYYFDPKKLPIKKGDHVIVETARGIEYGSVVANPKEIPDDEVVQPLKAVMRIATPDDDARVERNLTKEKDLMNQNYQPQKDQRNLIKELPLLTIFRLNQYLIKTFQFILM